MANPNPKLKGEIEHLREDASKIVSDISNLSKTMRRVGEEKSQATADELSRKAEEEIKVLKEKMKDIEARSKEYAETVDKHIKQNPYMYIIGSLGLGFLLGKLSTPKQS